MARRKLPIGKQPSGEQKRPGKPPVGKLPSGEQKKISTAERSAYFARREAAKVLHTILQGDSRRRAVGSIKSLVFSPSVRNKRGTYALVVETLKYLPVIKDILRDGEVLNGKWKRQAELMYIVVYDILFSQKTSSLTGDAEKFLVLKKDALQSALARLLVSKHAKNIEDLVPLHNLSGVSKPRYVRVNTLKVDVESALLELKKQFKVEKDDVVPGLLKLPSGTDLHKHPLVASGSVFLQGRASCMVASALEPNPGWSVLDACSAPGNKTVHLAAIMNGKGKIIACEHDERRVERLALTVKQAGATNVEVKHGDFLDINPEDPCFSKIRAILLDPSCSGSGTTIDRLDHLLPSYTEGENAVASSKRLSKLAAFQKKALEHALSFPAVERIVYSTCSVNQIENEDVVKSVLPLAASYGFQLATVHPKWTRRGLPVVDGWEHLLRTDLVEDGEGFFIALFVRKVDGTNQGSLVTAEATPGNAGSKRSLRKKRKLCHGFRLVESIYSCYNRSFRMMLYSRILAGQKPNYVY